MAVTVTNWTEFKTAIGTQNETVEIANDIDCGNEPVTNYIDVRCAEIIGNDHKISRIVNTSSNNVFWFRNASAIVSHLKFTDIYHIPSGNAAFLRNPATFRDCQFQGAFKNFTTGNTAFERCTFSFENGVCDQTRPIFDGTGDSAMSYCWIDIGEQTNNFTNGYVFSKQMSNCYIKGKLSGSFNRVVISSTYCVWNIFSDTTASIAVASGSISLNNSDRAPNFTNATNLTDTELKDRAAVQATGFPLINIGS